MQCTAPGCRRIIPSLWLLCDACLRDEGKRHRRPRKFSGRYPFGEMAVGDRRIIDMPRRNVAPAAAQYGQRHAMQFAVYRIEDEPDKCELIRRL